MLQPAKTKYRKSHRLRGSFKGKARSGAELSFGSVGLKAQSAGELSSRQIEAARQAMTRHVKRGGQIWIRIFPHTPVSRKPQDVKMGSGKGSPEFFIAKVKPGTVMFEMDGVTDGIAREALRLAGNKLPVSTMFIEKEEV